MGLVKERGRGGSASDRGPQEAGPVEVSQMGALVKETAQDRGPNVAGSVVESSQVASSQ